MESYFISEKAKLRHQQLCLAFRSMAAGRYSGRGLTKGSAPQPPKADDSPVVADASSSIPCLHLPCRRLYLHCHLTCCSCFWCSRLRIACWLTPPPLSPTAGSIPELRWKVKWGLLSAKDYTIFNPDNHFRDNKPFLAVALSVVAGILREEPQSTVSLKYGLVLGLFNGNAVDIGERFNFKV